MKISLRTTAADTGNRVLIPTRTEQIAGIVLMFWALGAQAQQPGYNQTSAVVEYTNPSTSQFVIDPVFAQYNYPMVSGPNSGFVGLTGVGGLGVPSINAGVYANSSNGGWVSTRAIYSTSMLVGSGTSGLADGTAVTLQMSLQLDGTTSATSGDDAGYAFMSFDMEVSAPDQATFDPGDGWSVPTVMNFSASADNSVNNFFTTFYGDPNGAWYHSTEYTSGWEWNSNTGSGNGGLIDDYVVEPGSYSSTSTFDFDTGVVLINFDTFVGDTLNISSYFDVYGDTYGAGSEAYADFLNTLQASINSPFVSGLSLEYGGGNSPVPVPAAIWLFASALIGFVGFNRRRSN